MSIRGFTTVEMLLACALSALLCAAAGAIISDLTRDLGARRSEDPIASRLEAAARTVRRDLERAEKLRTTPDEVLILSSSGLERGTPEPVHRPVLVRYEVAKRGDSTLLVRTQCDLDDLSNENVHRHLVSGSVRRLAVRFPGKGDPGNDSTRGLDAARDAEPESSAASEEPPASPKPLGLRDVAGLAPVPRRLEVALWPREPGTQGPFRMEVLRP